MTDQQREVTQEQREARPQPRPTPRQRTQQARVQPWKFDLDPSGVEWE